MEWKKIASMEYGEIVFHSIPYHALVIGKHGVPGLNENERYLLQLCCSNGLRVMNRLGKIIIVIDKIVISYTILL